jgi:hypothetical protein
MSPLASLYPAFILGAGVILGAGIFGAGYWLGLAAGVALGAPGRGKG